MSNSNGRGAASNRVDVCTSVTLVTVQGVSAPGSTQTQQWTTAQKCAEAAGPTDQYFWDLVRAKPFSPPPPPPANLHSGRARRTRDLT